MGVKDDIQQKKRATMNARAKEAMSSGDFPEKASDPSIEWIKRIGDRPAFDGLTATQREMRGMG